MSVYALTQPDWFEVQRSMVGREFEAGLADLGHWLKNRRLPVIR
jgi:hypothetical protein